MDEECIKQFIGLIIILIMWIFILIMWIFIGLLFKSPKKLKKKNYIDYGP